MKKRIIYKSVIKTNAEVKSLVIMALVFNIFFILRFRKYWILRPWDARKYKIFKKGAFHLIWSGPSVLLEIACLSIVRHVNFSLKILKSWNIAKNS